MLETALIRQASVALLPAQLAELRGHLAAEREAIGRTDVSGRTRLLADFHVTIATMLGNAVLASMLGELVSRSSLIALMFQSAHSAEHSHEEHVAIVDALERHDARAAVRLMEGHLLSVEKNLHLHPRVPDLASARNRSRAAAARSRPAASASRSSRHALTAAAALASTSWSTVWMALPRSAVSGLGSVVSNRFTPTTTSSPVSIRWRRRACEATSADFM
jgi:hypothetical protein